MRGPQTLVSGAGDQLEGQIVDFELQAKAAAERGDISAAARFILMALDCERRLAARSPQVLQLIKPRGQ